MTLQFITKARDIVHGVAEGLALNTPPISFLGDIDVRTGRIAGQLEGVSGISIRGRVLLMTYARGSAGAWRILYQLAKHQTNPAAIITDLLPDPSLVQGAILAGIPVICSPELHSGAIATDTERIRVESREGGAVIYAC